MLAHGAGLSAYDEVGSVVALVVAVIVLGLVVAASRRSEPPVDEEPGPVHDRP